MIEFNTLEFDRLLEGLQRLRDRGLDTKEALTFAAELAKNDSENTFSTETSTLGQRWEPSQRVKRRGGTTLTRTGTLAGSIEIAVDENTANVGTNVPYGKYHQDRESDDPFLRQFLGIEDESVEAVLDRIERMLEDA